MFISLWHQDRELINQRKSTQKPLVQTSEYTTLITPALDRTQDVL